MPVRQWVLSGPALPLPPTPTASPLKSEVPRPQTPGTTPSRLAKWATLPARIYEVFPLVCPSSQTPFTFIAFLPEPIPEDDFDQSWGA